MELGKTKNSFTSATKAFVDTLELLFPFGIDWLRLSSYIDIFASGPDSFRSSFHKNTVF